MKKICFWFLLSLFITNLNAQNANIDWALAIRGSTNTWAKTSTTDSYGNIYIAGQFQETVDFDPGIGSAIITANGVFDFFIVKLNPEGNLIWVKTLGGSGTDGVDSIAIDNENNVYLTGYFMDMVDFDPGTGTSLLTSNGITDIFLQKLDIDGNFVWVKSIGGSQSDYGRSIVIGSTGDVYITGTFQETVDFDSGSKTDYHTSNGKDDIFIQRYHTNGDLLWTKSMGGSGFDYGNITIDNSDNIYLAGAFEETVEFDPEGKTNLLTSNGKRDIFVQKLNSNGNFIWAKSIGWIGEDIGSSIVSDISGNIYITGEFFGSVDFDPGTEVTNLPFSGGRDAFVLKLSSNGNFLWGKSMGGAYLDRGINIITDFSSNVYTIGQFSGSIDINPGTEIFMLTTNQAIEIFVQKLDVNGNFVWAKSMGGEYDDHGTSLTIDSLNNIYASGYFTGAVDFNIDSEIIIPGSANSGTDTFIVKLNQSSNLSISENQLFNKVKIFPNPSKDLTTIDLDNLTTPSIKVFNLQGQLIFEKSEIFTGTFELELNKLSGVYFVQISSKGLYKIFKLIKQ